MRSSQHVCVQNDEKQGNQKEQHSQFSQNACLCDLFSASSIILQLLLLLSFYFFFLMFLLDYLFDGPLQDSEVEFRLVVNIFANSKLKMLYLVFMISTLFCTFSLFKSPSSPLFSWICKEWTKLIEEYILKIYCSSFLAIDTCSLFLAYV